MIISLAGFMGSGKSSVGRILSSLLDCPFLDLDDEIMVRSGISISEWFSIRGEEAFRSFELETLRDLVSASGDAVLAVGGGTPCIPEASDILKNRTECVYLKADACHLERILSVLDNSNRPLLRDNTVSSLLEEREQMYESTAKYTVSLADYTDAVPDENVFYEIAECIKDIVSQ